MIDRGQIRAAHVTATVVAAAVYNIVLQERDTRIN